MMSLQLMGLKITAFYTPGRGTLSHDACSDNKEFVQGVGVTYYTLFGVTCYTLFGVTCYMLHIISSRKVWFNTFLPDIGTATIQLTNCQFVNS